MSKAPRWALASLLLLVACGPLQSVEAPRSKPAIWWQGDLVELDGQPVSSGIRIEIQSVEPLKGEGPGTVGYRLETGCKGAGRADASGSIRAAEILRPCEEADVPRMKRLKAISNSAQMETPPGKASLRWNDREATLASPTGTARFLNSVTR